MKFYNSLTNQVEDFVPRGEEVSLYVCGITPYDTTHVGHAFTYCFADILVRYLQITGLRVKYVQNVTDIDDDILKKAAELGKDWREVGNEWTAHYIQDMKALNVRPPDFFPRATDVIPEIISRVQNLIERGVAYESGGSVYFDVTRWDEFGKLCKLPRDEMLPIANQRGNNPEDPNKRNPLDFVLWQAQAPGEPAWESPWGMGRPGWHIECSTMSNYFLGEVVDIHSGGADLCFPHHEAEIAQVEPITGKVPFVRYWMHVAMVEHEGEKMSKSLGNLVMVRDLLERWPADAIRFYLGRHHYRASWSYDKVALQESNQEVAKIREAVSIDAGQGPDLDPAPAWASFMSAMNDDLDSPAAEKILVNFADEVLEAGMQGRNIKPAQEALREMSGVFGVRLDTRDAQSGGSEGWDQHLKRFLGEEKVST